MTRAVEVVAEVGRAQALLDPARLHLLEHMQTPASAAELAQRVGQPRQRVNYHLRDLEAHGLIEIVSEARVGSVLERVYRRRAATYAVSCAALGKLAVAPDAVEDRFSSSYQIALASQAVRELAELSNAAEAAGKELPTFSLTFEVRFASPAARHAFAHELGAAVAELARRHHDEAASEGRTFRCYVGAYPKPKSGPSGGPAVPG